MDFERAYGYQDKWVKWVKVCIKSAMISVFVNGSLIEEFKPWRGLRQGNPLAPFLFLIIAKGLTGLVREAKNSNLLEGVSVKGKRVHIDLL